MLRTRAISDQGQFAWRSAELLAALISNKRCDLQTRAKKLLRDCITNGCSSFNGHQYGFPDENTFRFLVVLGLSATRKVERVPQVRVQLVKKEQYTHFI